MIGAGHTSPHHYTPKSAIEFYNLFQKRKNEDSIRLMNMVRTAYHADDKEAKNVIKELLSG